jgi:hypothetical protein
MKRIFYAALMFLGAAILLSASFSVRNTRAADSTKITIAYSANLMGYMEPCG